MTTVDYFLRSSKHPTLLPRVETINNSEVLLKIHRIMLLALVKNVWCGVLIPRL